MNHGTPNRAPAESPEAARGASSPRSVLLRFLIGNQLQQAIHVAACLKVADVLAAGPMHVVELAAAVNARADALRRLLLALSSFGIFEQQGDGRFALTPTAALLRDGTPDSLRAFAIWSGGVSYRAFGALEGTIRTGRPAFEELFGMDFFEYLATYPDIGEAFDDVMSWNTRPLCPIVAGRDFSNISTVVDLGGGRGELLAAVLAAHPHVRGTLVDRRPTTGARKAFARMGVEARCDVVHADILEQVPAGADLYLLKSVLHGLDDSQARRVLENCRRAMAPQSTLLVIELLLPDGNDPSPARLMDLLMLIGCHGRERTRQEFEALFASAGFPHVTIAPGVQAFTMLEATSAAAPMVTR